MSRTKFKVGDVVTVVDGANVVPHGSIARVVEAMNTGVGALRVVPIVGKPVVSSIYGGFWVFSEAQLELLIPAGEMPDGE